MRLMESAERINYFNFNSKIPREFPLSTPVKVLNSNEKKSKIPLENLYPLESLRLSENHFYHSAKQKLHERERVKPSVKLKT